MPCVSLANCRDLMDLPPPSPSSCRQPTVPQLTVRPFTVSVYDFPPELTLEIIPHLSLKGLVAAEGVCRQWKAFVAIADIYPPRRALFNLYKKIIHDPLFHDLDTRPWLWANLQPFDRQAYLDYILSQHNYIPEDFRLWILEWPNKAVIACAWPGLPAAYCDKEADDVERIAGYNHLGCLEPQVYRIIVDLFKITLPDGCSDGGDFTSYCARLRFAEQCSDAQVDQQVSETVKSAPKPGPGVDHHPGYYLMPEMFDYEPPAVLSRAQDTMRFPAILVWEKDNLGQTWLVLSPESPFAVYSFPDNFGEYQEYMCHQYPTWIAWLESQLRRMHRAADWKPKITGLRRHYDEDGNAIDLTAWLEEQERYTPRWTEEDEEEYIALTQTDG
ncbi:hypothetical protein FB45DRAFT_1062958 [Roridomyces roridus]|uniref:F-box domain-containing protein n=1 Tax=Roridomyces roridus TaxID=1738132 RepID=A0AAD7FEP3_9AGAR|nr:hypothetical protein FB45DRAFT_1062958 [Roridomyces roridus]